MEPSEEESVRRIEDDRGQHWDVVVGRESWGVFYALFVPVGEPTDRPIRQTGLGADATDAAHREVDEADESGLRELLRESHVKR